MAKSFDSSPMRETIRRLIRGHMLYKGYEYKDLSRRLDELGVLQGEPNLRSKVNNGSLSAQVFVYILIALDHKELDMIAVREMLAEVENNS